MKYDIENRTRPGRLSRGLGFLSHSPDVTMAAKSGTPSVDGLRPTTPATVPIMAPAATGPTGDISIQTAGSSTALDNNPDARANPPAAAGAAAATPAAATPAANTPEKPAADAAAKTDDTTAKTTGKKKKKKKNRPAATQ